MKAKSALVAFLLSLFYFAFVSPSFAISLFSTDFENQNISGWSSSGGGASATVSAEFAKSSNYSLKVQNDKTSSYGYQVVIPNIEGGMFYQAQAFGKSNNLSTASFFIRVAWYSSSDGSGSQLSTPSDSNQGISGNDWVELKTSAIQAPASANSAKFRLVLTSNSTGNLATAFFDDVNFSEAVAPTLSPIPTFTPTPILKPTNTPTPTVKPTNIPTVTKAISKTLPSNAANVISTMISPSQNKDVLAGSTNSSVNNFEEPKKEARKANILENNNFLPIIFIAIGVVFLLACVILFFYPNIKNYLHRKNE